MTEPKVFDTFMYAGESDLLEMRLTELEGRVFQHIITESSQTHRGEAKPLYYLEERARFAKWAGRIKYVVADGLPEGPDNWRREHCQRDQAARGLALAGPHDLVLIADVDELPSETALAWRGEGAAALMMITCHSAVDLVYREPQYASVIARMSHVAGRSLGKIRDGRYGYPQIADGGWHFSWVGSQASRDAKLDRTCHLEMPQAEWHAIASGATYEYGEHHAPDTDVIPAGIDGSWPRWVREQAPPDWFRPKEAA